MLERWWPGRWLTVEPRAQSTAVLGGEWDVAVIDCRQGLRPDLLGAVGGAVAGGGLLVLMTPPLADWAYWRDPDYRRMAVYPYAEDDLTNAFWRRLRRMVDDPAVLLWEAAAPDWVVPPCPSPVPVSVAKDDHGSGGGDDQRGAIAAVLRTARGRRGRPLVLAADRGRGKSAAMGIAAAQLLEAGQSVVVTAPRPEACRNVFRHAADQLGSAGLKSLARGGGGPELRWGEATLRFVAVDALLDGTAAPLLERARLLLIDEAGALPLSVLSELLPFARCVFATTLHGYEGTGRGFALRFLPLLAQRYPQWRRQSLAQPLRWARNDPLEAWLYRTLLLDAAPLNGISAYAQSGTPLCIEAINRNRLAEDEGLLRSVYGLLVQAHYRTSPDDLRQLLDAPELAIRLARRDGHVLGVLVSSAEGPLPAELHQPIRAGRRRPQGHLLPQSLAFHGGADWALAVRWQRIVRIAVAPEAQRQGIGAALIEALAADAATAGSDCLGVSFAGEPGVLAFWRDRGFRLLRVGIAAGAGVPLMMGRSLTDGASTELHASALRLGDQLPTMLSDHLRRLDPNLVVGLLQAAQAVGAHTAADMHDVQGYLAGRRALETCLVPVAVFCRRWLANPGLARRASFSKAELALLVGRVLQHQSWEAAVAAGKWRSRSEAEQALRGAIARLASHALEAGWPERAPSLRLRVTGER